jgi:uncharacterized repeat protein (TIGR03837 family)
MPSEPLSIDLFCRVIDNLGDIGVCWRLARRLDALGSRLRLVVDDLSAFSRIEPRIDAALQQQALGRIVVCQWPSVDMAWQAADVVIEAFACDMPQAALQAMRRRHHAGHRVVWINLEYLSAEDWVTKCHGLPSPQGAGLVRHFFFPGFGPRTGGLLGDFKPGSTWPLEQPRPRSKELRVSLFCYPNAPIPELLQGLSRLGRPVCVFAPLSIEAPEQLPDRLCWQSYNWLDQAGFDTLLAHCDLNLVRGEDSFVRAQRAGRPMLWQAYPQAQQAHVDKLHAWVDLRLQTSEVPEDFAAAWRLALDAWNGVQRPDCLPDVLPDLLDRQHTAWQADSIRWAEQLDAWPELGESLLAFIRARL